jgi:hypothetical protein
MSSLKQLGSGRIKDKEAEPANAVAIRVAQSFNKLAASASKHIWRQYDGYLESAAKAFAQLVRLWRRLWKGMAP